MGRSKRVKGTDHPTPFSKALSKLIRNIAQEKGEEETAIVSLIAKETGINRKSIDDWKDNQSAANTDSLVKIAQCLNVSCDYLLGLSDDPARAPSAVDELGLTPEAIKVLKSWKRVVIHQKKTGVIKDKEDEYFTLADVLSALLVNERFQSALRRFRTVYFLNTLLHNTPNSLDEMRDLHDCGIFWASHESTEMEMLGKLTPLIKETIMARSRLDVYQIVELHLQHGLSEVRAAIEELSTQ